MSTERGLPKPRRTPGFAAKFLLSSQALVLALSPLLPLSAEAQGVGGASTPAPNVSNQIAQFTDARPTTILPTDVVPLPAAQERMSFGENLQLRVLQRLPARSYFNASVETSFRYESNIFQFPTKRKFLSQIYQTTPPPIFRQLNEFTQGQILNSLGLVGANDHIFRVLPNVTGGWTLTPRTRVFGNYFMIRDQLAGHTRLNTVIHSVAMGIQQDIPITRRGNLQLEFQARELYQIHSQPVFDFLPAATFSYILTPRTVLFVNALLQMRGKKYFQAPTKEIDPFYTAGFLYQRGGWSFSNTATFVQNFREPFRGNASIPQNNYSMICDFEIARRLIKQMPGLQAFLRAEPIWNFHSHNRPGLAGMDFRLFYGMRFSMGKPPLTAALEQIRQQLEEQEGTPPPATPPGKTPAEPKPSAYLMPYQLIAGSPQPIHGFLDDNGVKSPETAWLHPAKPETALPALLSESVAAEPVAADTAPADPQPVTASAPAEPEVATPAAVPQWTAPIVSSRNLSMPVSAPSPVPEASPAPAPVPAVATAPAPAPVAPAPAVATAPAPAPVAPAPAPAPAVAIAPAAAPAAVAPAPVVVRDERPLAHVPGMGVVGGSTQWADLVAVKADEPARPQLAAKPKSKEVDMVLVPPLPSVNLDDENPFAQSGVELRPPAMFIR